MISVTVWSWYRSQLQLTKVQSHYTPSLTGTKSKIPSKLRESSTTSFLDRSPTTASSRSTSPAITPVSSAFSIATQSPHVNSRGINSHPQNTGRGRGKVAGTGPPLRRPAVSPPRPPPRLTAHHSVVPDYGMRTYFAVLQVKLVLMASWCRWRRWWDGVVDWYE